MITANFSDIVRILLYKENPVLFHKLNFEEDNVFLDPLLFAYFNSKKARLFSDELLAEIVQGNFVPRQSLQIKHSYNQNGIAYIPNIGYFKKEANFSPYEPILAIDRFELIKELHPVLEGYLSITDHDRVVDSNPEFNSAWKESYLDLEKAIYVIKEILPEFYKILVAVNKKIFVHDNPDILNFTSMETFGMLYFYFIEGDNTLYFIEELIHQGMHNQLYVLLYNKEEYFKHDPETIWMKDLTGNNWDFRNLYDAFHGVFTVYNRLICFDQLFVSKAFEKRQKHEFFGRFADQFKRFKTGVETIDLEKFLTPKGRCFFEKINAEGNLIIKRYQFLEKFDLSNREVDFRYKDFCILNPYEDFIENEIKGDYVI